MRFFRLFLIGLVLPFLQIPNSFAGPGWTYAITSNNHSFFVQSIQLDGAPISAGDYVGVFFQDGINRVCGGYLIWNGSMAAVTAWGDNPATPQKDGFAAGETIQWQVWHATDNQTYHAFATYNPSFQYLGSFTNGGLSGVSLLQFSLTPVILPLNAAYTKINPGCNGSCNGSISVQVADGTPPYGYAWSNGATSASLNSLCAGTYTLTISDHFGQNTQQSLNWTYTPTSLIHLVSIPLNGIFLYKDTLINGVAQVLDTLVPQAGDYIGAFFNNNGNPACGGYLQWTGSGNSIQIFGDNGLTPQKEGFTSGEAIQWKFWRNSESISIEMNDSIKYSTLFPQQGNWTSGGISALTHLAGRFVPNQLPEAQDTVLTIVLTQPAALQMNFVFSDYNGYEVSNPDSADGSIQVSISGGTPPFSYAWSNGSSLQNLLNIEAGNYSLTLSDANGCSATSGLLILEAAPVILPLLIDYQINHETCAGDCDAAIEVEVSGGVEPYTFLWSNGATNADLSNLCPGFYTLTLTDQSGLPTGQQMINLEIEGNQPITLNAQISNYNGYSVSAFGASDASIEVSVQGGIAPYLLEWSNGSNAQQLSSLPAGVYGLNVTDQNNCELDTSFTLTQPAQIYTLTATQQMSQVSCYNACNGAVQLNAGGGVAPYYYSWSNAQNTAMVDSLCAGTYTVTISDSNVPSGLGNPFNWQYSVGGPTQTILISAGTVKVNGTPVQAGSYIGLFYLDNGIEKCGGYLQYFGSSTTLTARGDLPGTPQKDGFVAGDAFIWKIWRTQDSITVNANPVYTLPLVNPGYFSSTGGLTVLGSLNAVYLPPSNTEPLILSFEIAQPLELNAETHLLSGVSCNNESDASIWVSAEGGTQPYTYNWSNGSNNDTLNSLSAGVYQVTVSDHNSCTKTATISVSNPAPLSLIHSISNETCYNCQNGIIDLAVSGGTQPYAYAWSNGATVAIQNNLSGGEYYLQVIDVNDCELTDSFSLTTNPVQRIYLPASWSMFSIFVDHSYSSIAALTAPVVNQIINIKDTRGLAYMPAYNLNQLTSLNPDFGYLALMSSPSYLYISGPVMNFSQELIELPKHWSILAYTRPIPGLVSSMLQSIQNDMIILKGEDGSVNWPAMNISDLNTMVPGKAYLIRMSNPASFTYPAID